MQILLQVNAYTTSLVLIFAIFGVVIILLACRLSLRSYEDGSIESIEAVERTGIKIPRDSPPIMKQKTTVRPIPGVAYAIRERRRPEVEREPIGILTKANEVRALRGGEFVGNRMRYKVKVLNDTPYMIVDITVYLIQGMHSD